ncbi:UNVERIFIED_CONTAM: hypothetical protein Sradi_3908200 [Sesamum radiatum]|uniref:Uncharacterized protein n=1 Tax=Sesamum radiatum TaxID=300843 RepID=A0AAW2PG17_SESRA
MGLPIFIILATLVSTSGAESDDVFNPIHLLRPRSGSGGLRMEELDCQSWQLAVETNNLQGWELVPASCEEYVGHYMLGQQYRKDCDMVGTSPLSTRRASNSPATGRRFGCLILTKPRFPIFLTTLDLMSNLGICSIFLTTYFVLI